MAEFFNSNLKYLRAERRIPQQRIADAIGVDRSTVSRIENGEIETTVENAIKIANVLNVSLSDLVAKDLRIDSLQNKQNIVVGKILKKYRQSKNMSMYDVVNKMNTPISVDELEDYENKGLNVESDLFKDLCNAIGVDFNDVWKEINSTTLYVNLKNSGHNSSMLDKISPDNELAALLNENTDILTDSDKRIIKTIIEERKKETEKEN